MEVGLEQTKECARQLHEGKTAPLSQHTTSLSVLAWMICTCYLGHFRAESHFESQHANLHRQHVVVTGGSSGAVRHPT